MWGVSIIFFLLYLFMLMLDVKALNCQRRFELLLPTVSTRLLLMGLTLQFSSVPIRFARLEYMYNILSKFSWQKMINCPDSIHDFLVLFRISVELLVLSYFLVYLQ